MRFIGVSGLLFLMRKIAEWAPFCSMITDREIGLLVLAICVTSGLLSSFNIRGTLARLSVLRVDLEPTVSRFTCFADRFVPYYSPFLPTLAPRAPPSVS